MFQDTFRCHWFSKVRDYGRDYFSSSFTDFWIIFTWFNLFFVPSFCSEKKTWFLGLRFSCFWNLFSKFSMDSITQKFCQIIFLIFIFENGIFQDNREQFYHRFANRNLQHFFTFLLEFATEIFEYYWNPRFSKQIYTLIVLISFIFVNFLKTLKMIAVTSTIGNILIFFVFYFYFYFSIFDPTKSWF